MACIGNGFRIRLAEPSDADAVTAKFLPQRLPLQSRYGIMDFHRIVELSLFSFVAFNGKAELVGFCSFNDEPQIPCSVPAKRAAAAADWANREAERLGFMASSMMWLESCATCSMREDQSLHVSRGFIRAIFTLLPEVQTILHPSPSQYPPLIHLFRPISQCGQDFLLLMCACERVTVLPALKIRRAKEEDHDELLPVVQRAQRRNAPLSRLPESSAPSTEYALARLIGAQDEDNMVLVAEAEEKLVGMMAFTANINSDYCFNFNVDGFDGLTIKEMRRFEIPLEVGKAPAPTPEGGRPSILGFAHEVIDPNATNSQPPSVVLESKIAEADESQNVLPDAEEEQAKFRAVEVEIPLKITNALQIDMICLDEEYEHQCFEFLRAAFKEDDRDYCLIAYPYTSRIHPLLQLFARVQCRPSRKIVRDDLLAPYMLTDAPPDPKVADKCLYLIHRDSLAEEFDVRIARLRDAEPLVEFLEHIKDRRSIVDLIENPRRGCSTVVAALSTQIVGFAMIEENVPVQALATHFSIKSLVDLGQHPAKNHGCITLFTMNPVFRHRRRLFLREIMRLVNKTILYCPVFPEQELPDVIEDLLLVPPRQHALMSPAIMWGRNVETGPNRRASLRRSSLGLAGFSPRGIFNGFDCALYLTTHRLASRYRIVVNSRILVAGASRTAEAFLHKLIADARTQFTNVGLISPSGFSAFSSHAASILDGDPGPGRTFSKLGIDCQVALKVAAVTDFHRKARKVQLSNGDLVPYDILILATGLQDQTRSRLKLEGMRSVMRVDDFLSQMDYVVASLDKLKVPREALPPGEGFVVIYGATLEAFYMVQLLLSKGVKGSNIVLAHPEPHLAACSSGDSNILSCLVEELSWVHVCVVSSCKLIAASSDDSGNLKNVIFEKTGQGGTGKYQLASCLLITCDRKQVDVPLSNAMRRENLIFDGRIVIDGRFQTNDSFILAAGTAVKFSRRCGKLPLIESFCSVEVGEALACSVMSKFVPSHVPDVGKLWPSNFPLLEFKKTVTPAWPTTPTPIFRGAKCVGGIFPGGRYHFSVVDPAHYLKNWESLRVRSLLTKCDQFYARFDFVESKQLARVLYCGKMKVCTWKLQRLFGLPGILLNNLLKRYSVGELNDIIGHIGQPWCAVFLHDQFWSFYHKLTEEVVSASLRHPKGDDLPLEPLESLHPDFVRQIVSLIERAVINFIDENRFDLPMYRLPRKKVDIQLLLPTVLDEDHCEAQEQHKVAASEAAATARIALMEVADTVKAMLERVAFTQEIRFAIDRVVNHVEGLRPVLLSLKGWGYLGVDRLVEEIEEQVMSITVWDSFSSRQAERLQDAKEVIERIIQRLERTEQIELAVDDAIDRLEDKLDRRFRSGYG